MSSIRYTGKVCMCKWFGNRGDVEMNNRLPQVPQSHLQLLYRVISPTSLTSSKHTNTQNIHRKGCLQQWLDWLKDLGNLIFYMWEDVSNLTQWKKVKVITGQHGCVYCYCSPWALPKDDKLFHVMFHRTTNDWICTDLEKMCLFLFFLSRFVFRVLYSISFDSFVYLKI